MVDCTGREECIKKLAELEQREKSNTHRIDVLEGQQKDFNKLLTAIEVMATKQGSIEKNLEKIDTKIGKTCQRLDEIEKMPAKRWETVVSTAITIIVGLVIGYFINGGK